MAIRQGFVKRRPALVLPDQWTPSQVESFALAYEAAQHGGGKQRLMTVAEARAYHDRCPYEGESREGGGEGPVPRPGQGEGEYCICPADLPRPWAFIAGLLWGAFIATGTTLIWVHLIARP